jgi:hypothetical protein
MHTYVNCSSYECAEQVGNSAEIAEHFSFMSTSAESGSGDSTASVTSFHDVDPGTGPRVIQGKSAMGAPLVTPCVWRREWTTPGAISGLCLLD